MTIINDPPHITLAHPHLIHINPEDGDTVFLHNIDRSRLQSVTENEIITKINKDVYT
jgi:hypothetical protein